MLPSQWLDKPEKWCKGSYAVTKTGLPVMASDPDACKWCVAGVINLMILKNNNWAVFENYLETFRKVAGIVKPFTKNSDWNDAPERTWEEVHAALVETERRLGLLENVNEGS